MPEIDWTLSVSDIVLIGSIAAGAGAAWFKLWLDIAVVKTRMKNLEASHAENKETIQKIYHHLIGVS